MLTLQAGEEDVKEDKVVLSTIHGAKGLEWDAVFVVRCMEGFLPMYFRPNPAAWPLPHAPADSPFQPAQHSVSICWPLASLCAAQEQTPHKPMPIMSLYCLAGLLNTALQQLQYSSRFCS